MPLSLSLFAGFDLGISEKSKQQTAINLIERSGIEARRPEDWLFSEHKLACLLASIN